MKRKVNEVAQLTGVTARTLHYYDSIGLLRPSEITAAGYRLYDERDLEKLQQILFFRELDFPLEQIREIMDHPGFDEEEALRTQRRMLVQKRDRLDGLIGLLDRTLKGERGMSFQEFDMTQIEETKKKYAGEAKRRWGKSEAYHESVERTGGYSQEQWRSLTEENDGIFREFANCRGMGAGDGKVQALVKQWQEFITRQYYACTDEILAGLGEMYMADSRFRESLDRFGEGTAKLMSEAIALYCKRRSKCVGTGPEIV